MPNPTNNKPITREDVLVNRLGLADELTAARIDEARCRNDSDLALIEAEFGIPADESDDLYTTLENVPASISQYVNQRWDLLDMIKTMAEEIAASQDRRRLNTTEPIMRYWKPERFAGHSTRSGIASAVFDGGTAQPLSEFPKPPYVVQLRNKLHIALPEASVPYGVVRIFACEAGAPRATILRILRFDEIAKSWKADVPTAELFGPTVPKGPIDYYVQPARRDLFAWFSAVELTPLANRLKNQQVKEREAVQALIHELEDTR